MYVIYRSWHPFCSCFGTLLQRRVVARTSRYYIVDDRERGYRKISKRRVLVCT